MFNDSLTEPIDNFERKISELIFLLHARPLQEKVPRGLLKTLSDTVVT